MFHTSLFAANDARPHSLILLRRRIEDFLDANLDKSELTIATLARRMGCSPRYIHRAFEAEATTPGGYIRELRLRRARDRILAGGTGASISDIAFSVGFVSSAHFSRAFRNRFDVAPRELRRRSSQVAR